MAARFHNRSIRAVEIALAAATLLTACGSSTPPRPTDPRAILAHSIAATAALPTARLHIEITAPFATIGGQDRPGMAFQIAIDADVEIATRQLTGRAAAQMPEGFGQPDAPQVMDLIVINGAAFAREAGTARWMKAPARGAAPGSNLTNAEVAAMLTALLSKSSVTVELGEASPCSLGTCDHVIAQVSGESLWALLGPILGMPNALPADAASSITLDLLVDQATSIFSEVRAEDLTAGQATRLNVTISNPGEAVLIAPPPPALIEDDMTGGAEPPVPNETSPPSAVESPVTP